ncbi:hypothetical protein VJ923_06110 [Adlercreutzia sp. R25]|uniref:Uncharacterized protein n=1 Tax=Adlercreutzia shanghongiae TaxID=3111773 RepID=A0ABU6IX04_9ACTN|nr:MULTISPECIES: hypothetical protein [unclassified Adlercreutzia]MEC4272726.1 hypothetical protein [Adlercreutzia sp. R25]MEC4294375.1 hypothetical protein [Adlercreutzia sp. R22]
MAPGDCPDEGTVIDGKKSYCVPWERWADCREMGHCTRESLVSAARNITKSEEED